MTAISIGLVIVTGLFGDDVEFLASLYSFGVLLAFAAAQLAVIRLRFTEPDLPRPFRAPLAAPLIGAPLAIGVLDRRDGDAPGGTLRGTDLARGSGWSLYLVVRRRAHIGLLAEVGPVRAAPRRAREFRRVLVPMKLGPIGEEMVATAVALAKERDARVDALFVIVVPLDKRARCAALRPRGARGGLARRGGAARRGERRPRRAGHRARTLARPAITDQAVARGSDLIVLGSSPRWRRQSAFFSPTVDYLLRSAPCEVLVVAFPQGVLEDVL